MSVLQPQQASQSHTEATTQSLPNNDQQWLDEILTAYASAEKKHAEMNSPIECIYRYAVPLMAKKRHIENETLIAEMSASADEQVMHDWEMDALSKEHFKFHFLASYIFAHVDAELINELEADAIVERILEQWDVYE